MIYKSIDLFAGIGGIRMGFDKAFKREIETVFISEWDKKAQKTYSANFKESTIAGDITKINEENIPKHNILLAGFPCQAFSMAGQKKGFEDTRGTLFFDVARIVKYHKPQVVFCENVKNLAKHDQGKTFKVIVSILSNLGYTVFSKILNSKNFGVPQNRERIYKEGEILNLPGISDDLFIRDKVPMTKEEIRILTMCKAKIRPDNIIWDIGAGTGSLSIEAAMLALQGKVYAVEKKDLAVELLYKNIAKFKLQDKIEVIAKEAPQGLDELPACDVVFIGGSGKHMAEILDLIDTKLKIGGRIIVNAVTIQTIAQIIEYMRQKENYTYEAIQVQVNRLRKVASYDMFNAQNPVYIVTCVKGDKK